MKKINNIIMLLVITAGVLIVSCGPSSKKTEEARAGAQIAQNNLNIAIQDSINDFKKFKMESLNKVYNYEKNISEIKNQISKEKKDDQIKYQKSLIALQLKNEELKRDLESYKNEIKDEWNVYKIRINNKLDNINDSISNFFKDKK